MNAVRFNHPDASTRPGSIFVILSKALMREGSEEGTIFFHVLDEKVNVEGSDGEITSQVSTQANLTPTELSRQYGADVALESLRQLCETGALLHEEKRLRPGSYNDENCKAAIHKCKKDPEAFREWAEEVWMDLGRQLSIREVLEVAGNDPEVIAEALRQVSYNGLSVEEALETSASEQSGKPYLWELPAGLGKSNGLAKPSGASAGESSLPASQTHLSYEKASPAAKGYRDTLRSVFHVVAHTRIAAQLCEWVNGHGYTFDDAVSLVPGLEESGLTPKEAAQTIFASHPGDVALGSKVFRLLSEEGYAAVESYVAETTAVELRNYLEDTIQDPQDLKDVTETLGWMSIGYTYGRAMELATTRQAESDSPETFSAIRSEVIRLCKSATSLRPALQTFVYVILEEKRPEAAARSVAEYGLSPNYFRNPELMHPDPKREERPAEEPGRELYPHAPEDCFAPDARV